MNGVRIFAFIAALSAFGACKPRNYNSGDTASISGEKPNQVTVKTVLDVEESLKRRLNAQGIKLCVGEIAWVDSTNPYASATAGDRFLGLWLGSLGCHKGSGYKLVGSGTGENIVTPLWARSNYYLDAAKGAANQLTVGKAGELSLYELCTGEFEDSCVVSVENNTLQIKPKK
jgi:hypothetical protein